MVHILPAAPLAPQITCHRTTRQSLPEYDLVLNNRAGRGFAPEPGHPNFPAPGRRPATTLHAWMVADETGRPRLAGGTPGGDNQLPWNAQTLGQVVAGCRPPDCW